jgi:hypothetical protein
MDAAGDGRVNHESTVSVNFFGIAIKKSLHTAVAVFVNTSIFLVNEKIKMLTNFDETFAKTTLNQF